MSKTLIAKKPLKPTVCVYLNRDEFDTFKGITAAAGYLPSTILKALVDNYDAGTDKISADDSGGKGYKTNVELEEGQKEKLKKIADDSDTSMSVVLKSLVKDFINKKEPKEYTVTFKIRI